MQKVFTTWNGDKKLIAEERIIPRHSAYGIVIADEKVLLISLKTSPKFWFPGGAIEEGESAEEAVVREVKEETGIEVIVNELLTEVESYFYYDQEDKAWQQFSHFYICTPKSIEIIDFQNPDLSDEADKPIWKDLDTIDGSSMQDYSYQIIELVRARKVPR